jgi:hypothetical protein
MDWILKGIRGDQEKITVMKVQFGSSPNYRLRKVAFFITFLPLAPG